MKNILIPIDLVHHSHDAIDYAIKFFAKESCIFYFLNTYGYDVDKFNSLHVLPADNYWFEKPKYESETCLGRVIQKYTLSNTNKKHRFNAISECNNLIEGIRKTIKDIDIDLVVITEKMSINAHTNRYSRNTKRIIENVRECPVMIIPATAYMRKNPEFILISSFEVALSTTELENWFDLVKIANGSIKIVTLGTKESMSHIQKTNQNKVRFQIELLAKVSVTIGYLETPEELKNFANYHSDYIICLMDKKPDFWRKCGLTHSQITKLGPMERTPLIALHG